MQIYFPKEELDALREAAEKSGRSVADIVRESVRKTVLKSKAKGPIALWSGKIRKSSLEHDSIYDDV